MSQITVNYVTNSFIKNQQALSELLLRIFSKPKKRDLHKIRVVIKKINAEYRLLEFFIPNKFNRKEHYQNLKKIFLSIGELRELQLIEDYMKVQHLPYSSKKMYLKFHSAEKDKIKRKQKKALEKFNENSFEQSTQTVLKLSQNLNNKQILIKTKQFIIIGAKRIKILLKNYDNYDNIHEIRKILKLILFTITFLNDVKPSQKIFKLIADLKETESIIGAWHDRYVLMQFIKKLIQKKSTGKIADTKPFSKIISRLSIENKRTLRQLKPKLEKVTSTITLPSLFQY